MPAPLHILRAPPFPAVAPAIAAVSVPVSTEFPAPTDDPAALIAAIRDARIGGAFWSGAPVVPKGVVIVRVTTAGAATALSTRVAGDAPVHALLPDEAWARQIAPAFDRTNITATIGDIDLWPLLNQAARLEAPGDDEAVLLALIAGVPVRCTSPGRFAGRGLTTDAAGVPATTPMSLEALAGTALCGDVAYRDCFTGTPTTALAAVARLAEWRRLIHANRDIAVAAGIALWKRREVSRLLWGGGAPIRFARSTRRAIRIASAQNGAIIAWPSRVSADLPAAAAKAGLPLHRIEDGFIRSVGLGSNLHPPLSIVADSRGVYYDPTTPSDLEVLLADSDFPPALLERARGLIDAIVHAGISKYSSGIEPYRIDSSAARIVLVAGQVEDDLSVRLGGGGVAGNLDLLTRARAAEPGAFVLFKPHPDVDAGHRAGRIEDNEALRLADQVVRDISMPALLDAVDGVHVLTSLAGFEALLRGRDVTVHGSPFYAGWGLTRDLGAPLPRRGRQLTLEQLAAATLILYPRYLDPVTELPCPPETLIARLSSQSKPRQTALIRARRLQGWLRSALTPIGMLP